jgi:ubiquitin C-terminal hydrolase
MGNVEEGNMVHFEDPQQRVFTHSDGSEMRVTAGLKNTGHTCYTNAYLQAIASCPKLPPYLKMPPNALL